MCEEATSLICLEVQREEKALGSITIISALPYPEHKCVNAAQLLLHISPGC